jgi:hypothetical protein
MIIELSNEDKDRLSAYADKLLAEMKENTLFEVRDFLMRMAGYAISVGYHTAKYEERNGDS